MMKVLNSMKKMNNQYVLMFRHYIGIHKLKRESKNCYFIYDKKLKRLRGFLKRKWYIIKIWGVKYGKGRI